MVNAARQDNETQITVRLPVEVVQSLDALVELVNATDPIAMASRNSVARVALARGAEVIRAHYETIAANQGK